MADPALQALLDPDGNGNGIMIERRVDSTDGVKANYYVVPAVTFGGRARWIETTAANSDAQKNTAIRAALLLP